VSVFSSFVLSTPLSCWWTSAQLDQVARGQCVKSGSDYSLACIRAGRCILLLLNSSILSGDGNFHIIISNYRFWCLPFVDSTLPFCVLWWFGAMDCIGLCAFMSHIPIELPLVFGSTANLLFQGFNFKISPQNRFVTSSNNTLTDLALDSYEYLFFNSL